ncbi:MAG: hypothetical protein Q4G51_03760 [Dermatophilus congolensis]|nr:hypothetical protein [Dermatophilus congolensis]
MTTLTFRADEETESDLAFLVETLGSDRSTVLREAVRSRAEAVRREQLRNEAEALRDDPADRAELRAVHDDLADLRVW